MSFLSQSFRRAGATVLGIFLAAGGSEVYAAPGGLAARAASLSDTAGRTATPHDMGKIRRIVADLKQKLAIPDGIEIAIVAQNPRLVSVAPDGGKGFIMSFQEDFLNELDERELEAAIAHELGHVWIFTHFPYLQTEDGANRIALRAVSRDSLAQLYEKMQRRLGVDLSRFIPAAEQVPPGTPPGPR